MVQRLVVVGLMSLMLFVVFSIPAYAACSEDIRALNERMATGKGGELDPQTVEALEAAAQKLEEASALCASGDEAGSTELLLQLNADLERLGR